MKKLLNSKLELIKKIAELTQEILDLSLTEDFEKYNELMDNRQDLINEIDIVDKKINNLNLESNESTYIIENEFKTILRDIIDMDKIIKVNIEKEIVSTKNRLNEVEKKLQTSNYELEEVDKKPKGYFLDTKS